MMSRQSLRCGGCGDAFTARIALGPTTLSKFYMLCPLCSFPIRGTSAGQDLFSHRLQLTDATAIPHTDVPDGAPVITLDPDMPAKRDADSFEFLGGMTTLTASHLTGDRMTDYLDARSVAREAVTDYWPEVRKLWTYYRNQNWTMFETIGASIVTGWEPAGTAHERATAAYQTVAHFGLQVCGGTAPTIATFIPSLGRKHLAACMNTSYRSALLAARRSGALEELETSLFSVLDRFLTAYEVWQPGHLLRYVQPDKEVALDTLILFRDEFAEARDLYQQGFELICRTLWIPVAAQNTIKRQNPDDFGSTPPDGVSAKIHPASLGKYQKLHNASKLAYVTQVPAWVGYSGLLNSRRRNAIGHGSARHDLNTGLIVTDEEPDGRPYHRFLADILDVFEALLGALQIVRFAQVASSPDFASNQRQS